MGSALQFCHRQPLVMKLQLLLLLGLNLVLGSPVDLPTSVDCDQKENSTFYPDYQDGCRSYYECVNGIKVVFNCPANLLWNEKIDTCDYPSAVTCKGSSSTTNFPTTHKETTSAYTTSHQPTPNFTTYTTSPRPTHEYTTPHKPSPDYTTSHQPTQDHTTSDSTTHAVTTA